jgi:lipoprotein NlpD
MSSVRVASHHMKMRGGPGILKVMKRFHRPALLAAASLLLAACGTMRSSVSVEPASRGSRPVSAERYRAPITAGSYVVVKGDTLYSIAFRSGVDFRDLARWNRVQPPYTIWPGQRLRLSAPASTSSSSVATTAPSAFKSVTKAVPKTSPTRVVSAVTVPSAVVSGAEHAAAPAAVRSPRGGTGPSRSISGVTWRWPADGSMIKGFKSGDAIPGIEIAGKSGDPVRAAADGVVVYSGNGLVGYGELVIIKHNDSFLSAYGHNRKRLVKEGQRVKAGEEIAEMGSTGASRNELEFQIRKNGNPVDPLDYLPSR